MNGTAGPGPSLDPAQILGEGTPELSRSELGSLAMAAQFRIRGM